jgi:putative SOS response-associated peptidase YedK
MCGRYVIKTSTPEIARILGADGPLLNTPPRYNVAPTEMVPVCRLDGDGNRELVSLKWGLIPAWSKDPGRSGYSTINARSETASEKPAFRSAFRSRRCLIPADGYYEWRKVGKVKQPSYIHHKDADVLVFAGLWERWHRDGEIIESCSILTTPANRDVSDVHDRMPALLDQDTATAWLDAKTQAEALMTMIRPAPQGLLAHYEVATFVNCVRNQGEQCIAPLEFTLQP